MRKSFSSVLGEYWLTPWRNARLAYAVLGIGLLFGLPLFLRMPPWCDLTLYDVAAANILRGGVHYKDVFDTNLPGFVWLLSGFRAIFGSSYEAIRFADLLILLGIGLFLDGWMKRGGANRADRIWVWAGMSVFYLALTESCHVQRDTWMMLPSLAAMRLRWEKSYPLAQGFLWGLAVWIKPHVVIPAAAVWFATAPTLGSWKAIGRDWLLNIAGGAVIGAAGIGYLAASGTWPYLLEVFAFWNTSYAQFIFDDLNHRYIHQNEYFPPWTYFHAAAIPLAIVALFDGPRGWVSREIPKWLYSPAKDANARIARVYLASLYLGWTAQGLFLQREFHYVHVPETLMMLALFAQHRWAAACSCLGIIAFFGPLIALGLYDNEEGRWPGVIVGHDPFIAPMHPIITAEGWRKWASCWKSYPNEPERRERMWSLSRVNDFHPAPNWVELGEVADYLKSKGVADGEVIAWNESPHAIYSMLKIRPAIRFLHVRQIQAISETHEAVIAMEARTAAATAKYVIIDLLALWLRGDEPPYPRMEIANAIRVIPPPPGLNIGPGNYFPYGYEPIYRSNDSAGRYVVLQIR